MNSFWSKQTEGANGYHFTTNEFSVYKYTISQRTLTAHLEVNILMQQGCYENSSIYQGSGKKENI